MLRATALLAGAAMVIAGCVTTSTEGPAPLDPASAAAWFTGLTPHADLVERLQALRPLGLHVDPIGASVEGRAMHLVTLGHGPFELWIAARHHGNEPTSTEAVLNTIDYLLGVRAPGPDAMPATRELFEHRALLLERLTFVIVPMANPDGAERFQRHNANDQDLNRDYLLFTEPESRNVAAAFWRVWPDAGLDVHNEGLYGGYDYDAYYPEVPRAESDTQVLSLANQWQVVHEIEASGGYAGGPNENYVTSRITDPCQYLGRYLPDPVPTSIPVPPPTDDTNPVAYCEGTHDAFLTLRGAPGWTPEAAIEAEPDSPTLPWAIRQHEATIASTAFFYAGLYQGCDPVVQKFPGVLNFDTSIPVTTTARDARFQLVWREDLTGMDQNLEELDLTVTTPGGALLGPELHPLGYTETLVSPEAGAHVARVAARTPVATPYELRVHDCVPHGGALQVERTAEGLRVTNTGTLPLEVDLQDSLVGDHPVTVEGGRSWVVRGNLEPKTMVGWSFAPEPGASRLAAYEAPAGAPAGPARWHAHGPAGVVLVGTTEERSEPSPS